MNINYIIRKVLKEEEKKHSSRYMFFSNLEQMRRQCDMLLDLDESMIEEILENGHDWAQDHIAEAKNNMDQVFDFLGCQCFYVYDIEPTTDIFTFENYGPFTSCSCESPRSANTESNICLEICTESGTTVVSVTPPHPIWTDGYGTQVTELNMITLGGMNGLNN